MEASEIFEKFQNLWRAGTNARLNLECHAGQVWMSLHVHLPSPPTQQQQHHHRRRPGPSRLRRRARRAKARGKSAEKAVESDNLQPTSLPSHVAAQATNEENAVEKITVKDVMHPQPFVSDAAVQADLYVHHLKAEHVEDALCPDQFFLPAVEAVQARPGNNLVQLDGAGDQEYDDQDHAHVQQSVSLNDFLGIVSHSRRENQDRLRQERENDLEEFQNMLKHHLP